MNLRTPNPKFSDKIPTIFNLPNITYFHPENQINRISIAPGSILYQ